MKYTVVWKRRAKEDLAELWLQAEDRKSISDAANQIDECLGRAPLEVGESRYDDYRILCVLPLVVGYHVSEADLTVTVCRVRAV